MRFATKIMSTAAALLVATATGVTATPYRSAGMVPAVTAVSMNAPTVAAPVVAAVLTQDAKLEVDIKTDDGGGPWYTQPMWIAIGVIALVLIILLAVVAGRRDTTTVVK